LKEISDISSPGGASRTSAFGELAVDRFFGEAADEISYLVRGHDVLLRDNKGTARHVPKRSSEQGVHQSDNDCAQLALILNANDRGLRREPRIRCFRHLSTAALQTYLRQ
jgi:hypothetical protein